MAAATGAPALDAVVTAADFGGLVELPRREISLSHVSAAAAVSVCNAGGAFRVEGG